MRFVLITQDHKINSVIILPNQVHLVFGVAETEFES